MKKSFVFILSIVVIIALISMPETLLAVKAFKVSSYGGGHQIWFEAEAFDERNPAGTQYFPITEEAGTPAAPAGAFDKAITRANGAGGMIRYTFDISQSGGSGGEWYFWGRIISPNNQSDFMLVEGDPDDAVIPAGPPFPGNDGTAPFVTADDRILEETAADWAWILTAGPGEGHIKTLKNGKNNMYIYHRQGDNTTFWDVFMWADKKDYKPTDADYKNAKTGALTAVKSLGKLSVTWGNLKN